MSNAYRDRLLGIGFLRGGLSGPRVHEGRTHPETGVAYKATSDELGATVTEHATRDDRVDVNIRAPLVRASIRQSEVHDA